jgi:hypothetical protein
MATPQNNDADIDALSETLITIADDLLMGRGFAVPVGRVISAGMAGKRITGKDGAGKEVVRRFMSTLVTQHPEVIDLAFAGMSEVAKARIRKMAGEKPLKDAEKA